MPAVSFHPSGPSRRGLRGAVRWLAAGAVLLSLAALAVGTAGGAAPARDWAILFIHVPAAWLSLLLYALAVAVAALALQAPGRLPSSRTLAAIAPVGVAAAFVALWTGLTSHQARGAWWGLDARLVCELVLLLIFAGLIALRSAMDDADRAESAGAVLVLVGALNIPIIYLTVDWWHTVHERAAASVGRSFLAIVAMALMTLAFCMYAGAVVLARLQAFARERDGGGTLYFESVRAEGASAPSPAKEQQ